MQRKCALLSTSKPNDKYGYLVHGLTFLTEARVRGLVAATTGCYGDQLVA